MGLLSKFLSLFKKKRPTVEVHNGSVIVQDHEECEVVEISPELRQKIDERDAKVAAARRERGNVRSIVQRKLLPSLPESFTAEDLTDYHRRVETETDRILNERDSEKG